MGEKNARVEAAKKVWANEPIPAEVANVVSALSQLRAEAVASPPVDEWT
jgi:hypothetical protein